MAERREATKQPRASREAVFHPEFREELRSWVENDRKVAARVLDLVEWEIEKVKHRRAVRRGRRISAGIEDAEVEQMEDDPYDVGINDKDIL